MRIVLIASMFLAVACKDKSADDTGTALTGDATAGAEVFSGTCAACHGDAGEGIEGYSPAMADEVPQFTDAELADIISNGYEEMPAQTALSDQDVADVIAYCRENFDG